MRLILIVTFAAALLLLEQERVQDVAHRVLARGSDNPRLLQVPVVEPLKQLGHRSSLHLLKSRPRVWDPWDPFAGDRPR